MEKTVREWLHELPEPYRSEALYNMNDKYKNELAFNLRHALRMAFRWDNTLQGRAYWALVEYDVIHMRTPECCPEKPMPNIASSNRGMLRESNFERDGLFDKIYDGVTGWCKTDDLEHENQYQI